ncbi:DUF4302 domain-containing protein [Chitinophaga sp. sic0106]|uniref:DUF4302 domain-containing protein n=1 Tax=Chitinophaga sp. sic0106 TaxID=2854785 RepID=UPI001C45CDEE|nr:DUF4302 domain-containing protein [Chitinophaga sp. sic0106]MBV7530280.1 DUF4302 domain-containing protein [Chitinophaga sp. sic0106]
MKKIIYSLLIGMIALSACKKEMDPVFHESIDQRLKDTLDNYQRILMTAEFGWNTLVFPLQGGAYSFYMKFTDSNRVQMFADFSLESSNQMQESSWRLKALQQPSLLFDTYSYLHELSDPDGSVNGGIDGAGLQSDFEFAFDGVYGDTVKLRGRFNHTTAYMVKATRADQDAHYAQQVQRTFDRIGSLQTFFARLSSSETKCDLQVDVASHRMLIGWEEAGKYKIFTSNYYYTTNGIGLANPYADTVKLPFTKLDGATWNNGTLSCNIDGKSATIAETVLPLQVDTAAPRKWYNEALEAGDYWQTFNGWHINGVEDAYNVHSTSRYYSFGYWPQYEEDIDLLPWIVVNAAGTGLTYSYGVGFDGPPRFDANGFLYFSIYGELGTRPSPFTPVANTLNKFADPGGYYLVKFAEKVYYMVSATTGKSWIAWYR